MGQNGLQRRPDHISHSVDLSSPPVALDFWSSQRFRGTSVAPIDHAPFERHNGVSISSWTTCGSTTTIGRSAPCRCLHVAGHFIDEVGSSVQSVSDKMQELSLEHTARFQVATHGTVYSGAGPRHFPTGATGNRG